MPIAALFLYAHAGHWLWTVYVGPVAIVIISIVKTTISERRAKRQEAERPPHVRGRDRA
jgi:hypothetical protein